MYKSVLVVLVALLPIISMGEPTEFLVNSYTYNAQFEPSIAMDGSGNFVAVWTCWWQGNNGTVIRARRFDNNNNPLGQEFMVQGEEYGTNNQVGSSVAMANDGNFVVTWSVINQDGSGWGVYAHRFDNNGEPLSGTFQVNTYTAGDQRWSSIAMANNGNFIITWTSDNQDGSSLGIYAQLYDNNGNPIGSEFLVNTYTNYGQAQSTVAMNNTGNFVITWEGSNGSNWDIYAQRYNNSGNPLGGEFQVNTYTNNYQELPSIAVDDNGNFVITWMSNGQDGSGDGVYAQRYDNNGNKVGGEFQVNTYTTLDQAFSVVAMDDVGNFVITWHSENQDGSKSGVYAQKYDYAGNPNGSEFQVNTYTIDRQELPAIAMNNIGDLIIVWQSLGQNNGGWPDYAPSWDIYAKHYFEDPPPTPTPTSTPTFTATPTTTLTLTLTPTFTPTPTLTPPPNAIDLEWFEAEAGFGCVILGWQTGTEIDTLGFYLVRSENFIDYNLVNEQIIPAQGNIYSGSQYIYIDNKIFSGRVYYYWLVDVDVYGEYKIHGPEKVITYLEERMK